MLLGSGIKGAGGALLGYASDASSGGCDGTSSLAGGWRYTGPVCSAADLLAAAAELAGGANAPATSPSAAKAAAAAASACELGEVWECPLLARLPAAPTQGPQQPLWLLAVSPFPVKPPYAPHQPANPVLYWVGHMCDDGTRCGCARPAAHGLSACAPGEARRQRGVQSSFPYVALPPPAPAGLTWRGRLGPFGSTMAMCCTHPTCAATRRYAVGLLAWVGTLAGTHGAMAGPPTPAALPCLAAAPHRAGC